MNTPHVQQPRSIFWPLTLIAAGALWLLISFNVIPMANLWALTRLWPVALIGFGLGLLASWKWPWAAQLVTALVVTALVLAVLFAQQLGLASPALWNIGGQVGGAIRGSGTIISETRSFSGLSTLTVEYPADVIIRQGDVEQVIIEGDDNLLPQLQTAVRFGEMRFDNTETDWQSRVTPSRNVQLIFTVKDLRAINFASAGSVRVEGLTTDALLVGLNGAGDVTLNDLQAKSLEFNQSGAGNINVNGTADKLSLRISGLGNLEAGNLHVQTADVRISGAGNATVWAERTLTLNISGAGSVRYYGTPTVTRHISGAGSEESLGNK